MSYTTYLNKAKDIDDKESIQLQVKEDQDELQKLEK